jgi:hypothetical protein
LESDVEYVPSDSKSRSLPIGTVQVERWQYGADGMQVPRQTNKFVWNVSTIQQEAYLSGTYERRKFFCRRQPLTCTEGGP